MNTKTGTVDTLATQVAQSLIDLHLLWERARSEDSPGGEAIVDSETQEIYAAWQKLRPAAGRLAQTLEVIRTASASANGIYSQGFVRKVIPLKRGMNLTAIYPDYDEAA